MTARCLWTIGAFATAAVAASIAASSASATATRAEYVAQVDPICQATDVKEKAAVRTFKRRIRRLHVRPVSLESKPVRREAVRFYRTDLRIFRSAIDQIAVVPPAPGDEAIITAWLKDLRRFDARFQRVIPALKRGDERQVGRALSRAFKASFQASNLVRDFGFQHCAG